MSTKPGTWDWRMDSARTKDCLPPNQLKALKSEWDKEKEEELVEEVVEYMVLEGEEVEEGGKGRCAATRGGKGTPNGVIDARVAFLSCLLS